MVIKTFGLETTIAAPKTRLLKQIAPLIAAAAILAGCQSLPEFGAKSNETGASNNKLVVDKPGVSGETTKRGVAGAEFDRATVKRVQIQLAELGFKSGSADGVVGPKTSRAIKQYQSDHKLPATGKISPRFLKHLDATAAHQSDQARLQVEISTQDFPTYQPGTSFVYSNGQVDRVSGADSPMVKWSRSDGTTFTTHRNFLLPWSNWANGGQRGTSKIADEGDELWPIFKGSEVDFSADVTVQLRDNPDSAVQRVDRWRCRNDGAREITVQAGTFETLMFVCSRGANPASPEVVRTWYYAKQVRHYVRFVEREPLTNLSRTVDLVAVRPDAPDWPPIVRAALGRAVVHSLETPENESEVDWTSSGVDTRVTIAAKSRFIAPDGRLCRRFEQIWSANTGNRHYHAVACKTAAGTWKIPGIEGDTADLLVTSGELS